MPLPNFSDEYVETRLCSLGGSLCLLGSIGRHTDIWEMKKYGVAESWAKLFTLPYTSELVPLQFVNNGEVLLGYDTDDSYCLDLFGLKLGTSANLKAYAKQDSFNATSFVYVENLVALNSGTYVGQVDEGSGNDNESEDVDSANDTGTKRERPQKWVHAASTRTVDLDSTNSGAHVSKDDNDLVEEEGKEDEMAEGFPASPKSVNEARETNPEKSRDRYNDYVEEYMDLKRRKLDLETRKLDMKHMNMDTSKMNALQLKWCKWVLKRLLKSAGSDMSIWWCELMTRWRPQSISYKAVFVLFSQSGEFLSIY
ncbi:hypothetical protein C5167_014812 [Papaver somniferum]|uniref:F-box associated domain-containing protein n=1 Tax=Papaver somniferum TaxID=3469 RepID=A0A4Y7J495_PAPSO|nr:hypothetical protein C5167_014812 [Papaver somniferum]